MEQTNLKNLVEQHQRQWTILDNWIQQEAPDLINFLVTKYDSLRKLALASSFSPTYLSKCRKGEFKLSKNAYIILATLKEIHIDI